MDRPTVHFASQHSSGNTFWILGAVCLALKQRNRNEEADAVQDEVLNHATDYMDALKKMNRHVRLIDEDEYYDLNSGAEEPAG